jgi:hypothetical protein
MTGKELDSVMRYFGAMFARWPQSKAQEVLVAYGGRVKGSNQIDVKQAIEELAEGSLLFPSVQEFVEAVRLVHERNKPVYNPPKLAAPKKPPLAAFVRSMRESGETRTIGPNEVRAFRIVHRANLPMGANLNEIISKFVNGGGIPLTKETYPSVSEFLAHEGYAVR